MMSKFILSTLALATMSLATPALSYDGRDYFPGLGTYGDRGGQDTVRCESRDYSFQRCAVRNRGDVYIVRQLSDTPCQQGQNWGYDRRGIWVNEGCAAEFAVGRRTVRQNDDERRYGYGYGQSYADGGTVRCKSEGFEFTRCRVRTGGEVRIARQLSDTPCRRGENWGFDRRGIWVDKGCAAEFSVAGADPYYTGQR